VRVSAVNQKVVLITGGARGVGAEVARRLHHKGANLVLTDVDEAALRDIGAELGGDRVLTAVADVRELAAMEGVAAQAVKRFGGIDVVMANAGISTYGSVLKVDPEAFRTLIDVNIVGVFNTVRAALPSVIERRGYVLIVSSAAAFAASAGLVPYNAAKAAVEQFANALRLEVAHHGVDVGSAHMLWIDTPLVQDAKSDLPSFRKLLDAVPGPLGKTTSVDACGKAFVKGIEARKRYIYCPEYVSLLRWFKPLLSTRIGESGRLKSVAELLPQMDAEVEALGRSMSARTQEVEKK
jgi:NAD(P)-dependent dehydrogenase (short-subunit alcohol dehydrogenase family)